MPNPLFFRGIDYLYRPVHNHSVRLSKIYTSLFSLISYVTLPCDKGSVINRRIRLRLNAVMRAPSLRDTS